MALPLESEIMAEVGLHTHFNWFNGSGSCKHIREQAAYKLPDVIQKHHAAGEKIAAPIDKLIDLGLAAAKNERGDSVLTLTWQVLSDVIQSHIHEYHADADDKGSYVDSCVRHWSPKIPSGPRFDSIGRLRESGRFEL